MVQTFKSFVLFKTLTQATQMAPLQVLLSYGMRSVVPLAGIEPALLAESDFESDASTSSAIGARSGKPKRSGRIIATERAGSICLEKLYWDEIRPANLPFGAFSALVFRSLLLLQGGERDQVLAQLRQCLTQSLLFGHIGMSHSKARRGWKG